MIQALLKRSGKFNENNFIIWWCNSKLHYNTTLVNGKEVELLGKEFDLLVYFLQNQNVILPKTFILTILGLDSDTTISVVESMSQKIRKIERNDFREQYANPSQCRLHFEECWINLDELFMRMIFHISFAILVYSHLFSNMTPLIIQIMRSGALYNSWR